MISLSLRSERNVISSVWQAAHETRLRVKLNLNLINTETYFDHILKHWFFFPKFQNNCFIDSYFDLFYPIFRVPCNPDLTSIFLISAHFWSNISPPACLVSTAAVLQIFSQRWSDVSVCGSRSHRVKFNTCLWWSCTWRLPVPAMSDMLLPMAAFQRGISQGAAATQPVWIFNGYILATTVRVTKSPGSPQFTSEAGGPLRFWIERGIFRFSASQGCCIQGWWV